MNEFLLQGLSLEKSFTTGASSLSILKGVSLEIRAGESLSIVGASGAGKSTLMHILGTLDRPDAGELLYRGKNILHSNDEELSLFRAQKMGFVFQFHHLVAELSALENVLLPLQILGLDPRLAQERARQWLERVGLGHRFHHYPNQLSGGELQRVSIARALVRRPEILFADEPTGNLDSQNSLLIQDLFFEMQKELQLTLVVVTHDRQFAQRFSRQLEMKDGMWASASNTHFARQ